MLKRRVRFKKKISGILLTGFSEIRVWTLGGDVIHTLSGHTSFIYSLAVLPSGDLISGGEDRSVRVWRDGVCAQTPSAPGNRCSIS